MNSLRIWVLRLTIHDNLCAQASYHTYLIVSLASLSLSVMGHRRAWVMRFSQPFDQGMCNNELGRYEHVKTQCSRICDIIEKLLFHVCYHVSETLLTICYGTQLQIHFEMVQKRTTPFFGKHVHFLFGMVQ
jgi:hypothetical protein